MSGKTCCSAVLKCKLLKLDGNRKSVSIDETRGPASIEENAMQSKKKRRRFIKRSKYRRIQKKLSRKPLDNLVIKIKRLGNSF